MTSQQTTLTNLRQRKESGTNKGENIPNYPKFFKNTLIIIISVILWVILSSNLIYLLHMPFGDSLPHDLNKPPYASTIKQLIGGASNIYGDHNGINSIFENYKFDYSWPYNLKDGNFIERWFGRMLATSWSTSRGLLNSLFSMIENLDERILLIIGGPLLALSLFLSTGTGFFTTIYGSLQLDLFSIILTICLFLIVLIIGWFNGMLMSIILAGFLLVKPLISKEGRTILKEHFSTYKHMISMAIGLFITINAFINLDATVAGGMLLALIGLLIASFV